MASHELKKLFAQIDRNHHGEITEEEFVAAMEAATSIHFKLIGSQIFSYQDPPGNLTEGGIT